MFPLPRPAVLVLAVVAGTATGILTHNGYGGEVHAIFFSDGEGNIEAGWAAVTLFFVAVLTLGPLFVRRHEPAAGMAGTAALIALFVTAAIVSTENDWYITYVPLALLIVFRPNRHAAWAGAIGVAVLQAIWSGAHIWAGLRSCCLDADLRFFLVALHVTPLLILLADVVALWPRPKAPPTDLS